MSKDPMLKKAHLKHMQGKHDAAAKLYHEILRIRPNHLDANYLLGTLYAETGNFSDARTYLEKADRLNPSSPYIKVNLGNICMSLGDYEGARGFYQQALALKGDLPQAFYGLATILELVDNDVDGAAQQYRNVLLHFQKAMQQTPNDAAMLQGVGKSMFKFGNRLALDCFHNALLMNPHLPGINRDYGIACVKFGLKAEAATQLRKALLIDGNDTEARYFLSIAEGKSPDKDMQQEYVRNLFDQFSGSFDKILVDKLDYDIPQQLVGFLAETLPDAFHFTNAIDLGCGTGLFGSVIRSRVDALTGVDISAKMIELAGSRNCYDTLITGELVEAVRNSAAGYDLFAATDVLAYIGDLVELFTTLKAKSLPEGYFVFSTESMDGEGFTLQGTGRYAHSPDYIRSVAAGCGCTIVAEKQVQLRREHGKWIMGNMYIVGLSRSTP